MKTKYISHRGNINGKVENLENSPRYIDSAIELGYDCEIDVWYHQHEFWLGHDEPTYQVDLTWLTDRHLKLWIHCKDLVTVSQFRYLQLNMLVDLNYFFHNTDDCTLTSRGDVWVYPGKQPLKDSIAVMPEIHNEDVSGCIGICSDVIEKYNK